MIIFALTNKGLFLQPLCFINEIYLSLQKLKNNTMKKLFYLLTTAIIITACSKDDAAPKHIDNALLGNWELEYYYRDDNDGDINIDNATDYAKYSVGTGYHGITFSADTACGFTQMYIDGFEIYSYNTNSHSVYITHDCNTYHYSYSYDYHIGYPIKYKLINNQLIIGSKSISRSGIYCVFYGFYKRKQ
jgi:hypothetical protein